MAVSKAGAHCISGAMAWRLRQARASMRSIPVLLTGTPFVTDGNQLQFVLSPNQGSPLYGPPMMICLNPLRPNA